MIVRLWRARYDVARRDEIEHIEETHLVPMLEQQDGFGGVLFLFRDGEMALFSMWRDRTCADDFADNPDLQALARRLRENGTITSEPSVEIFDISGGSFGAKTKP